MGKLARCHLSARVRNIKGHLLFGALSSFTFHGATSRVSAFHGATPGVAQQQDCLISLDNHHIYISDGPVIDVANPRHSSTTRPSTRLCSPMCVLDVKSRAFDQAVQWPITTRLLSSGEGDQLLISLGNRCL